jgi:hypothetical protein
MGSFSWTNFDSGHLLRSVLTVESVRILSVSVIANSQAKIAANTTNLNAKAF